jgi:hypothetical protein
MTTRLPIALENIRIASPCAADWDDMRGDERVRFCGRCEKNVYNLSSMTRADAEALVNEKEGRLCVRFYQRGDGTMLTADCPVGVQRLRLKARIWASLSGAAASAALLVGLITGRAARADVTVPTKSDKPTATASTKGVVKLQGTQSVRGEVHVAVAGGMSVQRQGEPMIMGKMKAPDEKQPEKKVETRVEEKIMKKPEPRMRQGGVAAPDLGPVRDDTKLFVPKF